MRHKKKGRQLGRTSSHRKAMLRNLAASLILTERDEAFYEGLYQPDGKTAVNPPAHKGRVVTTIQKAKEVKPLVEKCVTIAKKALPHERAASEFETDADRNSEAWKKWRESDQWQQWSAAMAPAINARRRVFSILRDKEAVEILFDDIAPRFEERPGGYTRVMRMATPRLGDAGVQAILEFVGVHDRVAQTSQKPAFVDQDDAAEEEVAEEEVVEEKAAEPVAEESPAEEPAAEADSDAAESEDK
jgi:large subunit ribosomal protein L17